MSITVCFKMLKTDPETKKIRKIQLNKYRINKITSLVKNLFQDNKKKD